MSHRIGCGCLWYCRASGGQVSTHPEQFGPEVGCRFGAADRCPLQGAGNTLAGDGVLCVGIVVAAVGEAHVLVGGADADAVHGCGAVVFGIVADQKRTAQFGSVRQFTQAHQLPSAETQNRSLPSRCSTTTTGSPAIWFARRFFALLEMGVRVTVICPLRLSLVL